MKRDLNGENFGMSMKPRQKVMILARPVRAPKWWPRINKREAAWVTVCATGPNVTGWTLGEDKSEAVPLRYVDIVEEDFVEVVVQRSVNFNEVWV